MISKIFLKDNLGDNKKSNIKKRIKINLSYFFLALFYFPNKITGLNELSVKI
jgi:hypothetical protein